MKTICYSNKTSDEFNAPRKDPTLTAMENGILHVLLNIYNIMLSL